jgi:lipopolysaccharide export system permease protein
MKLVDRYIGREFLKVFALSMSIFLCLYVIADLFDNVAHFMGAGVSVDMVARYYLFMLPYIALQVLPVSVLFASLLSLGNLNRFNELVAFKMAGLNPYRLASSIFALSALFVLIALLANEYFIPSTNQKAFDIKRTQVEHLPPYGVTKENDIWYRVKGNRIINVSLVDVEKQKLYKLAIFEFDGSNRLVKRWDAREAQWTGSGWILQDGYLRTFEKGMLVNAEQFAEAKGDLNITPLELARAEREPEEMNFRELKAYIRKLSASGIRTTAYKVDLQTKLSIVFTSLVMSLIGTSFALRLRSRSLLLGAGVSLLVGLGYWIVLALGITLGHSGKLPPFLAAWAGNLLFGAGGLFLLWQVRN